MKKYLTLNDYDGSLGGILELPSGANDTPSPGGMSSIDHHWTHGLFGYGDRTLDAYEGTGDRYIYGPYGNLYTPNAHASIYDDYRGPSTDRTQHVDLHGDPYFWEYGGPATNKGQELVHHGRTQSNMDMSKGRPIVPREGVGFVPSNIEHFQHGNTDTSTETSIEFIEDPNITTTAIVPLQREFSQQKPSAKPSPNPSPKLPQNTKPITTPTGNNTCKKPPHSQNVNSVMKNIPDAQKTTEIKLESSTEQKNKTALILVLIGVLVCIDLWGEFTHVFIAQYLNKGKDVTWVRYAIYAIIATITIVVVVNQSGVKVPVCA